MDYYIYYSNGYFIICVWFVSEVNTLITLNVNHLRIPAKIGRVDEEDSGPRHGGWCGSPKVGDLEQQPHGVGEWDTLVTGKGEDLVVIHDGVEGLDPHGINVTIQYDPLGAITGHVGQVSHDHREQT